jgi:hypothetical protein
VSSGADGAEPVLLDLQQKREGIAVKMCVVRMVDGRFLYMHNIVYCCDALDANGV